MFATPGEFALALQAQMATHDVPLSFGKRASREVYAPPHVKIIAEGGDGMGQSDGNIETFAFDWHAEIDGTSLDHAWLTLRTMALSLREIGADYTLGEANIAEASKYPETRGVQLEVALTIKLALLESVEETTTAVATDFDFVGGVVGDGVLTVPDR